MKFSLLFVAFTLISLMGLSSSGCLPRQAPPQTSGSGLMPTASPGPGQTAAIVATEAEVRLPALTLKPGDMYFSVDGRPAFLFSRNIAGYRPEQYAALLDWSRDGGSTFVRIQLDSMGMGYTQTGDVDPAWLAQWDRVFDKAEEDGIYVLPVFSGWFDWNSGPGYSTWKSNPWNAANGGPIQQPAELFEKNSSARILWLHWVGQLIQHWQGRKNILGWEIFSEVNLASGVNESSGVELVDRTAAVIRAADGAHRPVTASLADTGTWPNFYRIADIDFINTHPYPLSAELDRQTVSQVRNYLTAYGRPVLIGESGLSAATPDSADGHVTVSDMAPAGIRHALWASVVSGAMNGRGWYWEDGFGIYFPELGMPFLEKYQTTERPAADFVQGVDFAGFKPVKAFFSPGLWGAVTGNDHSMIGWYRDAKSEPPAWPTNRLISGVTVSIVAPGASGDWRVVFIDTRTGKRIIVSDMIRAREQKLAITLPDFKDDIAFLIFKAAP